MANAPAASAPRIEASALGIGICRMNSRLEMSTDNVSLHVEHVHIRHDGAMGRAHVPDVRVGLYGRDVRRGAQRRMEERAEHAQVGWHAIQPAGRHDTDTVHAPTLCTAAYARCWWGRKFIRAPAARPYLRCWAVTWYLRTSKLK